ncbi:MAG TPA: NAD(P)/FAD-dependent oxidoreductase [Nitrososphaerales archaeon]|nr:NAD(P)/FAD-dependent oxidoreductase [Nitrososphaerales archaeon]
MSQENIVTTSPSTSVSSSAALVSSLASPRQDSFDIVIIGAGPAGLFATYYAGFREMRTALLDALPEAGGQLSVLYPEKFIFDVPGYAQVLARDLVNSLVQQAMRYSPTMRLGERANELRLNQDKSFTIVTDKGSIHSKCILITAGVGSFSPNKLNIQNQEKYEGNGIYYFVKHKDFFKDKNLLIVGGGDSAVDWALNLKEVTRSIVLIHRRDQFRAHEQSVKELYSSPGITVKTFCELKSVDGDGSVLKEATILDSKNKKEEKLPVDCILINIGFKANLGPIANWGLAMENRAIKINGKMETNLPGVFAAGDIAAPVDSVKLNLIATAFAQAAIAINVAKKFTDPSAQLFPGHSSEKSA